MSWSAIVSIVFGAWFIWRWKGFFGKVALVTWQVIQEFKENDDFKHFAKTLTETIGERLKNKGLENPGEVLHAIVDKKPEHKGKRFLRGVATFLKTVVPFIG